MSWPRTSDAAAEIGTVAEPVERELGALVAQHYPRLIRLAGLVCDRTADAEDAVQAALEQAWRRRTTLRDIDRLAPWLDRIVVREAIRIGKRQHGLLARFWPAPRAIRPDTSDDGERNAVDHPAPGTDPATTAALRIAYGRLPAPQRAVVALHLYSGYSIEETAAMVGVPVETVRSRLRLARQKLRDGLAEGSR
jgi:RNA polymerase sigma-70 factor (ECF subfamily)